MRDKYNNIELENKYLQDDNIALKNEIEKLKNDNIATKCEIDRLKNSTSWKITKPLRKIKNKSQKE